MLRDLTAFPLIVACVVGRILVALLVVIIGIVCGALRGGQIAALVLLYGLQEAALLGREKLGR